MKKIVKIYLKLGLFIILLGMGCMSSKVFAKTIIGKPASQFQGTQEDIFQIKNNTDHKIVIRIKDDKGNLILHTKKDNQDINPNDIYEFKINKKLWPLRTTIFYDWSTIYNTPTGKSLIAEINNTLGGTQEDIFAIEKIIFNRQDIQQNNKILKVFYSQGLPKTQKVKMEKSPEEAKDLGSKLLDAAEAGNLEQVNQLLQLGANPDYAKDDYSLSALYIAAKNGDLPLVKLLVEKGANKEGHIFGNTVLAEAIENQKNGVARYLLDKVSLTPSLASGGNYLHIAAKSGSVGIIPDLVDKNPAWLNEEDIMGKRPIDVAKNKVTKIALERYYSN